jgi:hypothetical protein
VVEGVAGQDGGGEQAADRGEAVADEVSVPESRLPLRGLRVLADQSAETVAPHDP